MINFLLAVITLILVACYIRQLIQLLVIFLAAIGAFFVAIWLGLEILWNKFK